MPQRTASREVRTDDMQLLTMLKGKIHCARVTEANVDYVGSITIDSDLARRVDLLPGELVHVWNVDNGQRFETYVMLAPAGSGVICVNGAAAHRVQLGHRVIVAAFVLTDEPVEPRILLVDERNRATSMVDPSALRGPTIADPPAS
ncbi:MAG TPA: aspartate 1-decarboxylase [Chthonomonadales bacterium]|nr:aspartate 1-decarboxylase [Chthonomonadales bacterium]